MPPDPVHADADAVDPDEVVPVRPQRRERSAHRRLLPLVAVGGMIGASARYALDQTFPTGTLPWATLVVNVTGCALIGALMVYVVEADDARPAVRPFLGVGVLGGYTTFSTYAVEANTLVVDGQPLLALTYLFGTVLAALAAVTVGALSARTVLAARHRLARRAEVRARARRRTR